jgi:hypothetical protein
MTGVAESCEVGLDQKGQSSDHFAKRKEKKCKFEL